MTEEKIYTAENKAFEKFFLNGFAKVSVFAGLVIMLIFFIRIGYHYSFSDGNNPPQMDATGQIGDFIGGVVGTIFSLVGVLLLFITLRDQRETFKKERFETLFFDLLKIHRENVDELKKSPTIGESTTDYEGRKVIQLIVSNILECREEVKIFFRKKTENNIYEHEYASKLRKTFSSSNPNVDLKKLAQINIPYCIVFFGINAEGRRIVEKMFEGKYKPKFYKPLLDFISLKPTEQSIYYSKWQIIREISDYKKRINVALGTLKRRGTTYNENDYDVSTRVLIENAWYKNNFIKYYGGNQFRLGHYFRHLYQTVTYVENGSELDEKTKYFYIKTLRAQLSTHEQILLFFNSLSFLGMVWELTPKYDKTDDIKLNLERAKSKMLITKYQLIKNIPGEDIFGLKINEFYPFVKLESNESYLS